MYQDKIEMKFNDKVIKYVFQNKMKHWNHFSGQQEQAWGVDFLHAMS